MIVYNLTKNKIIVRDLELANTLFERIWGHRQRPLEMGEGFLIPFSHGIQTFGMQEAVDVLYLTGEGEVVDMSCDLEPNSFSKFSLHARLILELPSGLIEGSGTEEGDVLMIDSNGVLIPTPELAKRTFSSLAGGML